MLAVFPFDPNHRIASRVFTITVTAIDADGTVQPNGLPVQLVRPVTFEMPILAQVP